MIRAGFIGTGGISGAHLECLKGRRDVRIVALCDVDAGRAEDKRKRYGGEVYTDYRQMLDRANLDAVWLCTPVGVRREPLIACADRGIPVFCEKPAARHVAEGRRIVRALGKRGRRVQVGYVFRCMPTVQALKAAIRDDRIRAFVSMYDSPVCRGPERKNGYFDKRISGGAVVDMATHNIDLLRYLFGEVRMVRGLAANPAHGKHRGYTIDEVLGFAMAFESGLVGTHVHSCLARDWRNEIVFSGEKRVYRIRLGGDLVIEEGSRRRVVRQRGSIYEGENAAFLRQVKSGRWDRNPCDYADGVASLALTLACDRAVEGKAVRLGRGLG